MSFASKGKKKKKKALTESKTNKHESKGKKEKKKL